MYFYRETLPAANFTEMAFFDIINGRFFVL